MRVAFPLRVVRGEEVETLRVNEEARTLLVNRVCELERREAEAAYMARSMLLSTPLRLRSWVRGWLG